MVAKDTEGKPKRKPRRVVSTDRIAKALTETRGYIGPAACLVGMTRTSLYRRVAKTQELKSLIEELSELNLDVAELRLNEAIEDREAWAVCFYLKTQGKKRGYIEKQELDIDAKVENRGQVTLYLPSNNRDDSTD